jgi:predicted dehydrogenase
VKGAHLIRIADQNIAHAERVASELGVESFMPMAHDILNEKDVMVIIGTNK